MPEPLIIRVVRPYTTVEDYLDAESTTIDKRGMLLVDAEDVPPDTLVRFVVSLESGEALIKAEGRVHRRLEPNGGEPGGLLVRFKRFGASTKKFVDRAVNHRIASLRPPPPETEAESVNNPAQVTDSEVSTPDVGPPPPPPSDRDASANVARSSGEDELGGLRLRPLAPVETQPNRRELLDRLRLRAQQMSDAQLASFSKRHRAT